MHNATLNRHEWLKGVTQDADLPDRVTKVAVALWSFANDKTGQLNPSVPALADFIQRSTDTVKRAISDLVKAGWLHRTEGRGWGNKTIYTLCSKGEVVAFPGAKKGADLHPSKGGSAAPLEKRKGAVLREKGGSAAPFYYKEEQPNEQKKRTKADESFTPHSSALHRFKDHRFPGSAFDGLRHVPLSDWEATNKWAEWLELEGFPKLCRLPIGRKAENGNETYFSLPSKTPPTCQAGRVEARKFFEVLLDVEGSRHAAQ
tara:strand:- start:221 stop:997 length:777 start_codon:yes stop_codon:yes gene_type:complete